MGDRFRTCDPNLSVRNASGDGDRSLDGGNFFLLHRSQIFHSFRSLHRDLESDSLCWGFHEFRFRDPLCVFDHRHDDLSSQYFWGIMGIQIFENNIITPIVVGSQVKVNALVVILAILVGGWLWGISGMVLFIPLVGVLKITLERIPESSAFGYLLGDDVPVTEAEENYWKILIRKFGKKIR